MSAACRDGCASKAGSPAVALAPDAGGGPLYRSTFHIPGMDCPAEEQMIRLHLAQAPVTALIFDLPGRTLSVDHAGAAAAILACLQPLGYGAELLATRPLVGGETASANDAGEARVLKLLLAINALMFCIELGFGWWAQSAGLLADALDMFADAAVYGVALYAVGRAASRKLAAARAAGVLQLLLALGALLETARHVLAGTAPEPTTMIAIAFLALAANISCLLLIYRHRHAGVHMQASYIFSANDVIANFGVIAAGLLVGWLGSPWPDWIIGTVIGLVVLAGALRILRLR